MSESRPKLDRGNLRRQAQRVESYKSLISRRRSTLTNSTPLRSISSVERATKTYTTQYSAREVVEDEQPSKGYMSSPGSSTPSPSSDSSQDYRLNVCSSLKTMQNAGRGERETSVMTRSATRKYASVGAIHNIVDLESELRVAKRWPSNVSYPLAEPQDDLKQLRDVVTRSFREVLTFCKTAVVPESTATRPAVEENVAWPPQEDVEGFIDLSPYITQESASANGNDESNITFHLNENFISHPFVNIITVDEDQEGTLVIHDDDGEYETVTLHSGESYLVNNKYFSTTTRTECNLDEVQTFSPNTNPDNPFIAIYNDHTYAAKPIGDVVPENVDVSPKPSPPRNEQNEFKLESALNDLLLNTAILKCLICNETPQEMMSQLDIAQSYLYSGNSFSQ